MVQNRLNEGMDMNLRRGFIAGVAILCLAASACFTSLSASAVATKPPSSSASGPALSTAKLAHDVESGPGWILATWNRLRPSTSEPVSRLRHTPQDVFLLSPDGD